MKYQNEIESLNQSINELKTIETYLKADLKKRGDLARAIIADKDALIHKLQANANANANATAKLTNHSNNNSSNNNNNNNQNNNNNNQLNETNETKELNEMIANENNSNKNTQNNESNENLSELSVNNSNSNSNSNRPAMKRAVDNQEELLRAKLKSLQTEVSHRFALYCLSLL